MRKVYLDYNASAPADPRVVEVVCAALTHGIGNASSSHAYGRNQAAAVEVAREQVASLVGASPSGVVFTSGATESNNLALHGITENAAPERQRLLISAVEHASLKKVADRLASRAQAKLDLIPVRASGSVNLNALEEMLGDDVLAVSVMAANSETGVLNPLPEIAELTHSVGALFHCDAVQSAGRLRFDISDAGADLVSLSSHKICGPGGVGALVGSRQAIRRISPLIHGGGQERGLRSGSLNAAGIVGFGAASELAEAEREVESARVANLRDNLVAQLANRLDGVSQNGDTSNRLPNTANLRFAGADAEAVAANLDSVAVSLGSACHSGSPEPSAVLRAMGLDEQAAYESLRFSLGRFTTPDDIEFAVNRTVEAVNFVRAMT